MLYWDSIHPKCYLDIFKSQSACCLTLVSIKTELGESHVRALMVKWMNSFLKFYSVNGTMDANQVADTINLILETYPYYIQEDFKLFFNKAKKGEYGEIFGRLDGSVILSWLKKYDLSRSEAAKEHSIREQDKFKPLAGQENLFEGTSYDQYLLIKQQASNGNKEAIRLLKPPTS